MSHADDLTELLQHDPPRPVPPGLRRKRRGAARSLGFIGGFFLLLGVPLMVFFFPWRIGADLLLDLGRAATATGRVTAVEETGITTGRAEDSRGEPVYRVRFAFRGPNGAEVRGVCYTRGRRFGEGETVQVEYAPSRPTRCRIAGSTQAIIGYWGLLAVLFPVAGLLMLSYCLRARRRYLRLLREGVFAYGHVESVVKTNVTINHQRRYRVTVAFRGPDGREHSAGYSAYGEEVELARERMAAGERVGLLVDPAAPRRVLLLDALV